MSVRLCLSPLSTADNYFPSKPQLKIWCVKPLSSFFILLYEKKGKQAERKKEEKEKRATTACLDFSSCTFHFYYFKCDDGSGGSQAGNGVKQFGLGLLFISFIFCILPGQATQNYTTSILIFVILYLSQGHQGEDHKAISIST